MAENLMARIEESEEWEVGREGWNVCLACPANSGGEWVSWWVGVGASALIRAKYMW